MTNDLSPSPEVAKRAQILLQRFLDRSISPGEATELATLWDRFPHLESEAKTNLDIDRLFRFQQGAQAAQDPARLEKLHSLFERTAASSSESLNYEQLIDLAKQSPSLEPHEEFPLPEQGLYGGSAQLGNRECLSASGKHKIVQNRPEPNRYLFYAALSFLFILFSLGIYHEFSPQDSAPDSFKPIARIEGLIDAVWDQDAEPFKPGRELEPDQLKLAEGLAHIRFKNGVEMVVQGPANLLLKTENNVFCSHGQLSLFVPPGATGFEVTTPMGNIVDLGTAFSANICETATEVHVHKGKIELRSSSIPALPLRSNQAVILPIKGAWRSLPADLSHYISTRIFAKKQEEYTARRKTVWAEQEKREKSDPTLLFRLDPKAARLAKTQGSRLDKQAVSFYHKNDRIDLNLGTQCDSLTMIASVRLERDPHRSHTILMGDSFTTTENEFLWQLDRNGMLQFHFNTGTEIKRFDTKPVVRRQDRNTWMTLAVVIDHEKNVLTHYLDGQVVGRFTWLEQTPIVLNQLTLGNEKTELKKKFFSRYFAGSIEDLSLFRRALSAEEITHCYHNNQ